jgi:CheY-like chemotaxis protein
MNGPATQSDGDNRTILLVEDDAAVREVTGVLLGGLGYRVLEAAQALAALALLESERAIDLLLTDIAMPGMSGLELAAIAVRRHPALRVVLTSGDAAAAAAAPGHARAVLEKPYRFETLTRALDAALS